MPNFPERIPYSAIVDRPPLRLPGGARIIVWMLHPGQQRLHTLRVWFIATSNRRTFCWTGPSSVRC